MSCLRIFVIIDRSAVVIGNRKDIFGGMNARDKLMPKSAMTKLLNRGLILDDPIFQVCAGS